MPQVLFLCTGNYYRSRFCEETFNHLITSKGKNWQATSRGLNVKPDSGNVGAMSPHVIEALADHGIVLEIDALRDPMSVQEKDFEEADRVIAVDEAAHRPLMAQKFPAWKDKIDYWQVKDLDENPTEPPLKQLERLLDQLISEL
ncbi:MAG: low molecular weight phosphatase family protein [Microcystaceae cyanobacterium]